MWMELPDGGPDPKRGDIVQTNIGDKRERTWLILRSRRINRRDPAAAPRYMLFMARWWELLPDTRMRLFNSAARNGGQSVFHFRRYPPKKKRQTFEQYMRRGI